MTTVDPSARSKKRSAASCTSTPRKPSFTFFIDRDLGRYAVARALKAVGAAVEVHDDHFRQDAPDIEWLEAIGKRGWIVVRKDRDIRSRPAEQQAFLRAGVRAFILRTGGLTGAENGAILARAFPRMVRFCIGNLPPVIASVSPSGKIGLLFRESPRRRRRRQARKTQ